jgi:archaellum component FlaC
MSKKNQNMIEQAVTALNRIADTLDDMDTAIWTMALEAAGIHDKIETIDTKLDTLLSEGLKVTVDFKTFSENLTKATPKPETAEPSKEAFPVAE